MEELISPKESTFPCYSDWCNFGLQEPLEKSCLILSLDSFIEIDPGVIIDKIDKVHVSF